MDVPWRKNGLVWCCNGGDKVIFGFFGLEVVVSVYSVALMGTIYSRDFHWSEREFEK